ncbi:MAG: hypothetical protein AAF648_12715 [Pseudomonadota bacterium]
MKKTIFAPSLLMAGLLTAGVAAAEPYSSWKGVQKSDDDQLTISDSFKSDYRDSSTYSEDNDVTKSLDYTSTRRTHEDNDITKTYTRTEDNDVRTDLDYKSVYQTSEDNDVTKTWQKSEDNDITKSWRNTEDNDYTSTVTEDNDVTKDFDYTSSYEANQDNDVTEDNDVAVDVDFQIATPTITSHKDQRQDAGHQAKGAAYGSAQGHDVGVQGGYTAVSAGNDETVFYGPAMVNNNTNQLPQNNLFVQGSNMAPISQSNTFAGRDMGPKGVFAPVGNTSAMVGGDVGQTSGISFDQAGDSGNSIQDPISSGISR